GRAQRGLAQCVRVEHVTLHEREARMLRELGAAERVAVQVVERDDLVLVDEAPSERRADEAGAAGDQDPLAAQSHAPKRTGLPFRRMRSLALPAVAAVSLVACSTAGAETTPATSLTIVFRATETAAPVVPTLRRRPAGGPL